VADRLVGIESGALRARINPLGAELWSLTDGAGREYMTDADPAFWTGHAPILFPIVGMLNGGRYRLDGREYALAKHGFARTSRFAVVETQADRATFRLTDSEATRAAYPFAFALDVEFRLAAATLHVTATITSRDTQPMPFSFGFHPAFAWPLPGGADKAAHRVVFARDEPAPIRRIDVASGLLLPEPEPSPVADRVLDPDRDQFVADAMIWDRLESRALSFGAEGGAWIDLAFPDCAILGIWQKPGAAYLALEPWQGINDPVGFAGDFRAKPGVVELAPGAEARFRLDVTVRPA
jgi:galactose mutarotase-like enzyme